jgi:hypothetical protein
MKIIANNNVTYGIEILIWVVLIVVVLVVVVVVVVVVSAAAIDAWI